MRGLLCAGLCATVAIGVAGCGGGQRQDANEKGGDYKVEITSASFPPKQSLADATKMRIRVHNADTKELPNVAVTIETKDPRDTSGAPQAFSSDVSDPSLADRSRPIWIVDEGPSGGNTGATNTWALGPLKAGASRTFEWKVTAVKPGAYTVDYSVSPGLTGKAKPAGNRGSGQFKVTVSGAPPSASVGSNGQVIRKPATTPEPN